MDTDLEQIAIENAARLIANDLTAIQRTLEELYRSVEEQFSKQAISNDIEAVEAVLNRITLAANEAEDFQELVSLFRQFQELLDQFRSKYRDLISNEAYYRLQRRTLEVEFRARFLIAFDYLVPFENMDNHYKGLLSLSEALEYGISLSKDNSLLFPENWLESCKNIAMTILDKLETLEVSKQLPASEDNIEELRDVISYKNAARGILWQIDNFEKTVNSSDPDLSDEEESEPVKTANQAMMEAWDLISRRSSRVNG